MSSSDITGRIDRIIQAQTFETLCENLQKTISELESTGNLHLLGALSTNGTLIGAIQKFKDHEKYHESLWAIIYHEHPELANLLGLQMAYSQPAPLSFKARKTKEAAPSNSHLCPVVIDNSHLPVFVDNTHLPRVVVRR